MGKLLRPARVGAALAVVALLAAACGGSSSKTTSGTTSSGSSGKTKSGGSVTFAIDETIPGWNVLTSADNEFVLQEVENQVLPSAYITPGNLIPKLDTDYVLSAKETSTNPQTIVYKLNPKAVWADGTPMNATDWIYNWQAQSGKSQYKDIGNQPYDVAGTTGYQNIQSVTASDNNETVTVVFAQPFGDWQSLFGDIIPAHIAQKVGWNTGFNNYQNLVSGGPYTISNYVKDQTVTETVNPKWWGKKPSLTTITFRILSADTDGPTAMQNNEVQLFYPASPTKAIVDQTKAIPNVTADIRGGLQFEHLDFNQNNPFLAMKPVRQAIALGIDRKDLIARTVGQVAPGTKPVGNRMFVPGQPEYTDNGSAYDNADPAKAKSLLQSAGFVMGSDGYFHKGGATGPVLSLHLSTTSGQQTRANEEQVIQTDLKNIGIQVAIQNYDAATLFGTNLPKGEYDMAIFAWVDTPFASGNLSIYCSYTDSANCGQNWIHYANPQVDSLLKQANTKPTTAAANLYNQADKVLWDDVATLPLFQKPLLEAWYSNIANVIPNTSNVGLTWNANDWALKAS